MHDLYIPRPVLLAEVGEPNGGNCAEGDDVSALLVRTYTAMSDLELQRATFSGKIRRPAGQVT